MAADAAIAEALKAGESTRARLAAEEQAANSMDDVDDPMQGTPPKSRKKRWGCPDMLKFRRCMSAWS